MFYLLLSLLILAVVLTVFVALVSADEYAVTMAKLTGRSYWKSWRRWWVKRNRTNLLEIVSI